MGRIPLQVLVLVASICCSQALQADKMDYWVLGSFSSTKNAEAQKHHLEDLLGIVITLMPTQEPRVTRLLSEKKYLSQASLNTHGLTAWTLQLDQLDVATMAGDDLNTEVLLADRSEVIAALDKDSADVAPDYTSQISEVPLDAAQAEPDDIRQSEPVVEEIAPQGSDSFELKADESVAEYCRRSAVDGYNPGFCRGERLRAMQAKTEKLSKHGLALKSFCQKANLDGALRDVCRRWQNPEQ